MAFLKKPNLVMTAAAMLLLFCASATAQRRSSPPAPPTSAPISSPTPAPAPAPEYVNLTDLLSVAGPFHKFLGYLQSTKVIETLQDQANKTEEGITLFVPRDNAFSALKDPYPTLSNLTDPQLRSLFLFHALPRYYPLSEFTNLSRSNPVPTLAGGAYSINFTDNFGTIRLDSGWTRTKVISAVHAADPVAIYETDRVLLPEAIFGTDIPPTPPPAPAPAPDIAPAAADANAPGGHKGAASSSPAGSAAPSSRKIGLGYGLLLMSAAVILSHL